MLICSNHNINFCLLCQHCAQCCSLLICYAEYCASIKTHGMSYGPWKWGTSNGVSILTVGIPESQIFKLIFLRIFPSRTLDKIPTCILGLLGHAAFYEDEIHYGVCLYTDQCVSLSFIVRVKVKWVLCYCVIGSKPVVYGEYFKT